MRKKNRTIFSNFTLIELLVVIAIIGILASLLMPALQSARDQATRITCAGRMRQQAFAFQMYADDYDGWWPYHVGRRSAPPALNYASMNATKQLVEEYTDGSYSAWACPDGFTKDGSPWTDDKNYVMSVNSGSKGGDGGGGYYYAGLCYKDNLFLSDGGLLRWTTSPSDTGYAFKSLAYPDGKNWNWGIRGAKTTVLVNSRRPNGIIAGELMGCPRQYSKNNYWMRAGSLRHGGQRDGIYPGGNVMFGDGSVEWADINDGFGAWMSQPKDRLMTFWSVPWIHWYRTNYNIQSTMPPSWNDYQKYYESY